MEREGEVGREGEGGILSFQRETSLWRTGSSHKYLALTCLRGFSIWSE